MDVTFQMKQFFFDRARVQAALDKANVKNLSRAGAFVRTRARSSLRRRKKASAVGTPPSVHSNDNVATLKAIYFVYDPISEGVIVGPVRLNQKHFLGPQIMSGTVPRIHEKGGTVGFREKKVGKRWMAAGKRHPRPGQPIRVRQATYPPRPTMGPALVAESPKFPGLWANSVR